MGKNKKVRLTHVKATDSTVALCGYVSSGGPVPGPDEPACGMCLALVVDEYQSLKEEFTEQARRLSGILIMATPPGCVTVDEKDVKTDG